MRWLCDLGFDGYTQEGLSGETKAYLLIFASVFQNASITAQAILKGYRSPDG